MSAAAPTAKALAQAKVKRQKQIVAVGSVILLALLGYQLPKLLGGGGTARPATTTATTAPAPTGSPLALAPGKLPDTDRVVIEPLAGQLVSFSLFKSKDPFVQQLSTLAAPAPSASGVPAPVATTPQPVATTPPPVPTAPAVTSPSPQTQTPRRTAPNGGLTPVTTTSPAATVPFPSTTAVTPAPAPAPSPTTPAGTTTPTTATTTPVAPAPTPTAVAISTNGVCENVALEGTFPGTEDIFRVVSIAKDGKSAKISVVGGAYDSGQATATLKLGEKLTLVNTADGTRYVLLLKSRCDTETEPVTESTTTTTTTTTTSTVAPPAPTTSVATPIVTDSLDTTTPGG